MAEDDIPQEFLCPVSYGMKNLTVIATARNFLLMARCMARWMVAVREREGKIRVNRGLTNMWRRAMTYIISLLSLSLLLFHFVISFLSAFPLRLSHHDGSSDSDGRALLRALCHHRMVHPGAQHFSSHCRCPDGVPFSIVHSNHSDVVLEMLARRCSPDPNRRAPCRLGIMQEFLQGKRYSLQLVVLFFSFSFFPLALFFVSICLRHRRAKIIRGWC